MRTALTIAAGLLGGLAGLVCISAGVYMAAWTSEAAVQQGAFDASLFDVLRHGMAIYFIGKGLAVWGITAAALRPRA